MIIRKGNLVLSRLSEEDMELVRQHRNSRDVSQYMEYREHITPRMQKKWFESVNNINNLYFVMQYKGKKIGLCNAKNIDWEKGIMEGGVFIWDKEYRNSPIPVIGFIAMAELGMIKMNLKVHAHILRDNLRAIKFNKTMGFKLCEGQENVENQLYELTKESYLEKAAKLRKLYYSFEDKSKTEIIIEKKDFETPFGEQIREKFNPGIFNEVKETGEGIVFIFLCFVPTGNNS